MIVVTNEGGVETTGLDNESSQSDNVSNKNKGYKNGLYTIGKTRDAKIYRTAIIPSQIKIDEFNDLEDFDKTDFADEAQE
jgi:hypothetical protein